MSARELINGFIDREDPRKEEIPITFHEALQEKTSIPWLAQPFLAAQTVNMLVADPGVGKTAMAVQMALQFASGKKVLGFTAPRPMQCLYIAAEGSRPAWIARMGKAAAYLGVATESLRAFVNPADMESFQIGSPGLEDMIRLSAADLVFLDTLGYFASFDENSATEWKQKVMIPLRGLVRQYGCSFMLIHHLNKDSSNAGWRKGRGTAAMFGDVDAFLRLHQPDTNVNQIWLHTDKNKYAPVAAWPFRFDAVNAVFEEDSL